jgi:two-component system sensor histidine kinase NreB
LQRSKNTSKNGPGHSGVSAEFITSEKNGLRLAPEVETNLYRIGQEALKNIHRHAKAQRAGVMLNIRSDSIVLIVEDDGIGFSSENKKIRNKGLDLIGMQERAALVGGGSVEVESATKRGTTIYVRVPIAGVKENLKEEQFLQTINLSVNCL